MAWACLSTRLGLRVGLGQRHLAANLLVSGLLLGLYEGARALATRTGAPVVVTLGVAGALVAEPDAEPVHVRAPAVEAVDTTGAGDVFNGALAAALAGGAPLRDAVEDAVAAASASVKRLGARG